MSQAVASTSTEHPNNNAPVRRSSPRLSSQGPGDAGGKRRRFSTVEREDEPAEVEGGEQQVLRGTSVGVRMGDGAKRSKGTPLPHASTSTMLPPSRLVLPSPSPTRSPSPAQGSTRSRSRSVAKMSMDPRLWSNRMDSPSAQQRASPIPIRQPLTSTVAAAKPAAQKAKGRKSNPKHARRASETLPQPPTTPDSPSEDPLMLRGGNEMRGYGEGRPTPRMSVPKARRGSTSARKVRQATKEESVEVEMGGYADWGDEVAMASMEYQPSTYSGMQEYDVPLAQSSSPPPREDYRRLEPAESMTPPPSAVAANYDRPPTPYAGGRTFGLGSDSSMEEEDSFVAMKEEEPVEVDLSSLATPPIVSDAEEEEEEDYIVLIPSPTTSTSRAPVAVEASVVEGEPVVEDVSMRSPSPILSIRSPSPIPQPPVLESEVVPAPSTSGAYSWFTAPIPSIVPPPVVVAPIAPLPIILAPIDPPTPIASTSSIVFTPPPHLAAFSTTQPRSSTRATPRPTHPSLPVIQVSSTDPRAAARATAILKVYHDYVEQGIEGILPSDRLASPGMVIDEEVVDREEGLINLLRAAEGQVSRSLSPRYERGSLAPPPSTGRGGRSSVSRSSGGRDGEEGRSETGRSSRAGSSQRDGSRRGYSQRGATRSPAPDERPSKSPRPSPGPGGWCSDDWRRLERVLVEENRAARAAGREVAVEEVARMFLDRETGVEGGLEEWDKLMVRITALQQRRLRDSSRRSQSRASSVTSNRFVTLERELQEATRVPTFTTDSTGSLAPPSQFDNPPPAVQSVFLEELTPKTEQMDDMASSSSDSDDPPHNPEEDTFFSNHNQPFVAPAPPLALSSARFSHLYDEPVSKPPVPLIERPIEPLPTFAPPSSARKLYSYLSSFLPSPPSPSSPPPSPPIEMEDVSFASTTPSEIDSLLIPPQSPHPRSLHSPLVPSPLVRTLTPKRRGAGVRDRIARYEGERRDESFESTSSSGGRGEGKERVMVESPWGKRKTWM